MSQPSDRHGRGVRPRSKASRQRRTAYRMLLDVLLHAALRRNQQMAARLSRTPPHRLPFLNDHIIIPRGPARITRIQPRGLQIIPLTSEPRQQPVSLQQDISPIIIQRDEVPSDRQQLLPVDQVPRHQPLLLPLNPEPGPSAPRYVREDHRPIVEPEFRVPFLPQFPLVAPPPVMPPPPLPFFLRAEIRPLWPQMLMALRPPAWPPPINSGIAMGLIVTIAYP